MSVGVVIEGAAGRTERTGKLRRCWWLRLPTASSLNSNPHEG